MCSPWPRYAASDEGSHNRHSRWRDVHFGTYCAVRLRAAAARCGHAPGRAGSVTCACGFTLSAMIARDVIRQAPKVLLHDHLDGGLRPLTVIELARDVGYTGLPTTDPHA